ncbi:hypothetical protein K1T73_04870 [Roseovarius sp. SCSIO 43702]|uniref:hypothetical protein n=1 Tax=Roseovarius sp. SCSIO 43702 TaxID=2823043 RepID=UPI001C7358A8|nr:hypothetical protein [Roseovarius sp. SCSIO 43702]QYX57725.1 hypothetical protein K1T73_04870 [Roseovarius sp. SCSIO 43702]
MLRRLAGLLSLVTVVFLAGCGAPGGPVTATPEEVSQLATAIKALGPQVDPEEAERAARVAYAQARNLAIEYEIEDPPLVHNSKVNMGLKPRGLCYHWAKDMEWRLRDERFETLELHRAIANADNPFRIEHSTAIISARGDTFDQGIVLDPWRKGGALFWDEVADDTRYAWVRRDIVMEQKRRRREAEAALEG